MNKMKATITALGLLCAFTTAPAYGDTIWDWSLTTTLGSGSGTFTTAGSSTAANTPFTITGITGTFGGDTITGLDTFLGADNLFEWDGTSLLMADNSGISFDAAAPLQWNVFCGACLTGHYGAIDTIVTPSTNGTVSDATLAPVIDSTPEPATSALLIAGAAVLLAARRFQRAR